MTPQQAIDAARAAGDAAKSRDPMTGSIVDAVVADIVDRLEALEPRRHFGRHRWDSPENIAAVVRALPATCGGCDNYTSMGVCSADRSICGLIRIQKPPRDCPMRKGDA